MKPKIRMLAVAAAAVLLPLSAQAQDSSDGWEWRATIYGWLTDISGSTQFPTGGGPEIEVGIDDILDSLDFTMMGSLQVNRGKWGLMNDVIYLDVGGSSKGSREFVLGPNEGVSGSVELDARLDLKSWLWTVAGTYALAQSSEHRVDLLFGGRMVDMSQELAWSVGGNVGDNPLPGRDGKGKISVTNWDAVIGIKGYRFFGDSGNWVLPWYFDVGTGDSDLSWQAMAGLGYHFNWGEVLLTYRYFDYDMGDSSPIADMNFAGPMIGASFAW